jgi:hypothetical protein
MSRRNDHLKIEIPDLVIDPKTRKEYKKGKFLGRVSFRQCFVDFNHFKKLFCFCFVSIANKREDLRNALN